MDSNKGKKDESSSKKTGENQKKNEMNEPNMPKTNTNQ